MPTSEPDRYRMNTVTNFGGGSAATESQAIVIVAGVCIMKMPANCRSPSTGYAPAAGNLEFYTTKKKIKKEQKTHW